MGRKDQSYPWNLQVQALKRDKPEEPIARLTNVSIINWSSLKKGTFMKKILMICGVIGMVLSSHGCWPS